MVAINLSFSRPLSAVVGVFIACGGSSALAMSGSGDAIPVLPVTLVDTGDSHEGDNVLTGLTVTNAAPIGSDGATAAFVSTAGDALTNHGQITGLAPGASDSSSLQVGIDTSVAGHRSGIATVAVGTDGLVSGTPKGLGTVDVGVQGDVFRLAEPLIGEVVNGTVFHPAVQQPDGDVGLPTENVGVGQPMFATLSIGNSASSDGFSEKLNATLGGVNGGVSATFGGISGLAPGDRVDNAITLRLDTSTPGIVNGEAIIDFVSDGDGINGLGQTSLGSRKITFGTTVYGEAKGVVSPGSINLNARVGDVVEDDIFVGNLPDTQFSVSLDASAVALGDARLTGASAFTEIPVGGGRTIPVSVDTSTSGLRHGSVEFHMNSNGAPQNVSLFGPLNSVSVDVNGKVYAPAVPNVSDAGGIDFGIVHVGDFVAHDIAVHNAASGALTDVLRGGVTQVTGPFGGGGDLGSGLAAGDTASHQMGVEFTATALGSHEGNARIEFSSHNDDMTDLALDAIDIALKAQVNAHAHPIFSQNSAVPVTGGGTEYLLDFGNVAPGDSVSAALVVVNYLDMGNGEVSDIDLLDGSFDITGAGPFQPLGFDDFDNFANPASGDVLDLLVSLDTAGMAPGVVEGSVILLAVGHNASGFSENFAPIRLRLRANVPLPTTLLLWLSGMAVGAYRLRGDRSDTTLR